MTAAITVSVADLRQVFEALAAHIEAVAGTEIGLSTDMFWSIPPTDLFDVHREPRELTIGQISESWDNLLAIREDPSSALSFGLVWMADVIRAIGLSVVS